MAGTLMSAVLRVTSATWRTPITRIAEAMTVMGLVTAGLFVIVDMGQARRGVQEEAGQHILGQMDGRGVPAEEGAIVVD